MSGTGFCWRLVSRGWGRCRLEGRTGVKEIPAAVSACCCASLRGPCEERGQVHVGLPVARAEHLRVRFTRARAGGAQLSSAHRLIAGLRRPCPGSHKGSESFQAMRAVLARARSAVHGAARGRAAESCSWLPFMRCTTVPKRSLPRDNPARMSMTSCRPGGHRRARWRWTREGMQGEGVAIAVTCAQT